MTRRFIPLFTSNAVSFLLCVCIITAAGLGCSGSSSADARPAPAEYHGAWRAGDDSTITIRSDASADYKSGGTSVSGGKAQISDTDKTLTITLFGMGPTLKIDKAPENGQMTLDGIVYKKAG